MTDWLRQREAGAYDALRPTKRGPKVAPENPLGVDLALIRSENLPRQRRLERADAIIELQKNCRIPWDGVGADRRRCVMDGLLTDFHAKGTLNVVCAAVGLSRASLHRRKAVLDQEPSPGKLRPKPARALSRAEKQAVLTVMHGPRCIDLAPTEIYATLLDEGVYLCSIRTLCCIHAENVKVRDQLRHDVVVLSVRLK